jgi:hypothetical protein
MLAVKGLHRSSPVLRRLKIFMMAILKDRKVKNNLHEENQLGRSECEERRPAPVHAGVLTTS